MVHRCLHHCVTPPAQEGVSEEDYYYAEYTAKEREEGLHLAAMKFVSAVFITVCKGAHPRAC